MGCSCGERACCVLRSFGLLSCGPEEEQSAPPPFGTGPYKPGRLGTESGRNENLDGTKTQQSHNASSQDRQACSSPSRWRSEGRICSSSTLACCETTSAIPRPMARSAPASSLTRAALSRTPLPSSQPAQIPCHPDWATRMNDAPALRRGGGFQRHYGSMKVPLGNSAQELSNADGQISKTSRTFAASSDRR